MANAKTIVIILLLVAAFSVLTISSVQADALTGGQALKYMNTSLKAAALPFWKITQDGTNDTVPWVDATNPRFAVYDSGTPADETDDVVLDKETGLVWERSPSSTPQTWSAAVGTAYQKFLGGRRGWRLPTVEELASLEDPYNSPSLPNGHPFVNVQTEGYWTSTTYASNSSLAWQVYFTNGLVGNQDKNYSFYRWCVRGGQGHDGY